MPAWPRTAAAAALAALAACARPSAVELQPVQEMEGFQMAETAGGRVVWTLKADRAALQETARTARLGEPRIEFYNDGARSSTVESRRGVLDTETRDVLLSSAVVARSLAEGSTLWTERLRYDSRAKKIVADVPVRLRTPEALIVGDGMEANPDLSEMRIKHQRTILHGKG